MVDFVEFVEFVEFVDFVDIKDWHFIVLVLLSPHVKRVSVSRILDFRKSRIWETTTLSTDADSSTDHKVIHNFHFLYSYLRVIIFFETLKFHIS